MGTNFCQFHSGLTAFDGACRDAWSVNLIGWEMKSYGEVPKNSRANGGFPIGRKRMPNQGILNQCLNMGATIEKLYERMYRGEAMAFNILDGPDCFTKTWKCTQMTSKKFKTMGDSSKEYSRTTIAAKE
jgi:hypothetical protein